VEAATTMKVHCDIFHEALTDSHGHTHGGIVAECSSCGHITESFGTTEASIRRCFALMREQCPRGLNNFYTDEPISVAQPPQRTEKHKPKKNQMENQHPLDIDIDLSEVTTTIPLIADNTSVRVRLKNITRGERDGNVIVKWEMTLSEPAPTEDGLTVGAGFPLYTNFDLSQEWLKQKMAKFIDGFLGTGDRNNKRGKPERPRLNAATVSGMIGAEATAKVVVQRSKKTDYVGNEIVSITHLEEGS
jgi:hypothetical protein